ncbi:hypothetical protein F4782DRAFT_535989 [Xylaria castorea]|nr:hypothetical protein F4782DRAFT_535989 [Xylaria castorea]
MGSAIKPRTSSKVREAFVQRVLGVTQINDSILEWLHTAIFGTGRIASPLFGEEGLFGSDEDELDSADDQTFEKETISDKSPFLCGKHYETRSFCGLADKEAAGSEMKNGQLLQSIASFDIWNSGSTTPGNKALGNAAALTTENTIQAPEAAHSLLQLFYGDAPAAARLPIETKSGLPDDSVPSERPTSFAKRSRLHSYSDDDEESIHSQHVPLKRRRFEDTYKPRQRATRLDDLFFTISAVYIRKGGNVEALEFNPEDRVWTDLDGVEYDFDDGKFTAARAYWGMLR